MNHEGGYPSIGPHECRHECVVTLERGTRSQTWTALRTRSHSPRSECSIRSLVSDHGPSQDRSSETGPTPSYAVDHWSQVICDD